MLFDAHTRSFAALGGVPRRGIYDNMKPAVDKDKPDLYALKFFTEHVLHIPWTMPRFIRPPKVSRLPDIVSVTQAQALFAGTRVLS